MKINWDIMFIKPCREPKEEHLLLTTEYAKNQFKQKKIVQINLDNCSIQRIEMLPMKPTMKDIKEVGLKPLVDILNSCPISLSAIGVTEMPDVYVKNAKAAYESFCQNFWPNHKDDIDATSRSYDTKSKDKKISFFNLNDDARCAYGSHFVAMLLIQYIKRKYIKLSPEKQFESYIFGIISKIDVISAFELELAKYAFWKPTLKERNNLPSSIKNRLSDINDNFTRLKMNPTRCQQVAFDSAMDIYWLSAANLTEDLEQKIEINGSFFYLDNWVGTNDHKLYRISRDIHSVYHDGSNAKILATTREKELSHFKYWQEVDSTSDNILKYRKDNYSDLNNYLYNIDKATELLIKQIHEH